jgi:hypothetical protein
MRFAWVFVVSLGAAAVAPASIIYRDIPDIDLIAPSTLGSGTLTAPLTLETGQGLTLSVSWSRTPFGTSSESSDITLQGGIGVLCGLFGPTTYGDPYNFALGSAIGPASDPPTMWRWATAGGANLAYFGNFGEVTGGFWSGNAYLGISLPVAGGVNYGWIGMYAAAGHITIRDYAYESDLNVPITAGAVPAAPSVIAVAFAAARLVRRKRPRWALTSASPPRP